MHSKQKKRKGAAAEARARKAQANKPSSVVGFPSMPTGLFATVMAHLADLDWHSLARVCRNWRAVAKGKVYTRVTAKTCSEMPRCANAFAHARTLETAHFSYAGSGKPQQLGFSLVDLVRLRRLSLHQINLFAQALPPQLEEVELAACRLGAKTLAGLTRLSSLSLRHCKTPSRGKPAFADTGCLCLVDFSLLPLLTRLSVAGEDFQPQDLPSTLRHLSAELVRDMKVESSSGAPQTREFDDEALRDLCLRLPELESISLAFQASYPPRVWALTSLRCLGELLPKLESVSLWGLHEVPWPAELCSLASLRSLCSRHRPLPPTFPPGLREVALVVGHHAYEPPPAMDADWLAAHLPRTIETVYVDNGHGRAQPERTNLSLEQLRRTLPRLELVQVQVEQMLRMDVSDRGVLLVRGVHPVSF